MSSDPFSPCPPVPQSHDLSLALKVGELDGKLSAVTERQSRHEVWVGAKLDSMDIKLDQIAGTLAASAGKSDLVKNLTPVATWLITGGASVAGWIVLHHLFY